MRRALPFTIVALALAACDAPRDLRDRGGPIVLEGVSYDVSKTGSGALEVRRLGRPFENWEGNEAQRAAAQYCVGRAQTSINDRFRDNAWLIVRGCA
ncbi:MAG: hypothetical protein WBA92_00535 [Pseudorhodobacter sp.]